MSECVRQLTHARAVSLKCCVQFLLCLNFLPRQVLSAGLVEFDFINSLNSMLHYRFVEGAKKEF
jgi:hypothetical protein